MRVLVSGDRDWSDYDAVRGALADLLDRHGSLTVIEGGARGADHHAASFCRDNPAIEHLQFPADWRRHGKAAGPIRNQQMLDEGKPELVIAFHDDLDASKGTKDMVRRARQAGIEVQVISHPA